MCYHPVVTASRVLIVWALLAAAVPSPAAAVVVVHTGEGGPAVDEEAVLRRLRRDTRFSGKALQVVPLPRLVRLVVESERAARRARARKAAAEGARLLGHLKLDEAVDTLRASLDDYAALQPDATTCAEAVAPLRALAFAHWQRQETALAAALLAGVAELPAVSLDTTRYPPPFVRFVRQAHALPTTSVKLPRLPGGARLWRSCVEVASPTESLAITGSALLRLAAPGHRDSAALVVPTAAGTVVLAALEPRTRPWNEPGPGLDQALERAGAEWVVFWRRREGALETRIYRRGRPAFASWRRLPAPPASRPSRALAGAVRRAPPTPAGPQREGKLRRAGPWLVMAGGAGALVTGTVLGLLARDAASSLEEAAERREVFDDRLAGLEDRKNRFGTAAYVLWGVGAAAVVGGVVWWLTARTKPAVSASADGAGWALCW